MKTTAAFSLLLLITCFFLPAPGVQASGGDQFASMWKCSDGNMYGLIADGNKRWLYLPTAAAPMFFSGVKNGNSYNGTIYSGGEQIPVSGPISKHSTRVTLYDADGCCWVLNFSHK